MQLTCTQIVFTPDSFVYRYQFMSDDQTVSLAFVSKLKLAYLAGNAYDIPLPHEAADFPAPGPSP